VALLAFGLGAGRKIGKNMNQPRKDQVFISYASEDLAAVKEVCGGLCKRGLEVWFDKKDKKIGPWRPRILTAITKSRYFVFCLSEAALKKTGDSPGFQDEELNYAYDIAMKQAIAQFTIVPIRLQDCDRGDHRLSTFQQFDYFSNPESCLDELAVQFGGKSLADTSKKNERTETEKIIDSLMGKAGVAYYAGNYEKALTLYSVILEMKPDAAKTWYNKGVVLHLLNRHEEALAVFERAIQNNPDYAPNWWCKGLVLGELNRPEEELSAYERTTQINPDFAEAWYIKGLTLHQFNRHEEALTAYERAIQINPDYAEAWYGKGLVLRQLNRPEEANAAFARAYEIKPSLKRS